MQYSNDLIDRLIDFINRNDALSILGKAIKAYDTTGLPVPINETYFSFSCEENSTVFSQSEGNTAAEENSLTIKMSCFSPIKKSAYWAHNLTEKIISGISQEFAGDIRSFTIGKTEYDDDVKSYKITGRIYFKFTA